MSKKCFPLSSIAYSEFIFSGEASNRSLSGVVLIGVLKGEGVGPEVIRAALSVLSALQSVSPCRFELCYGGEIGNEAELKCGRSLSAEVKLFCQDIFDRGGAILTGPGSGRFVYDLRSEFGLFCKLSPLKANSELAGAVRMKPEHIKGIDILLVRENLGGIYQGKWHEMTGPEGMRIAEQACTYTEMQVREILNVAARIAKHRHGSMSVVLKEGGIPAISRLWRDCAEKTAEKENVTCSVLNVDNAAFYLIQDPYMFDVMVAPNLFGDILADVGSVLLGSRGLSYSGNFSQNGAAVYQTNHGAAYDIAGKNEANPVAQIFSLAMMLKESFGLIREALLVEDAVTEVWKLGWRTADIAEKGCRIADTETMGDLIADALIRLSGKT